MRYMVSELADEIGVSEDTIYKTLIPAGCPHERDEKGHIWIIGTDFAVWARADSSTGRTGIGTTERSKLPEGHARCFRCGVVRPMNVSEVTAVSPYVEVVKGTCVECGAKVNRFQRVRGTSGITQIGPGEAWCEHCRKIVFVDGDKCPFCRGQTRTEIDARWRNRRKAVQA
jgi:hypothetical protein